MEGKIQTNVDLKYFKKQIEIEKVLKAKKNQYTYLVSHKNNSYMLKGLVVKLQSKDKVGAFKESKICEVYKEYYLIEALSKINSYILKPLYMDYSIYVPDSSSNMCLEIIYEYDGVSLETLTPLSIDRAYNLMYQLTEVISLLHNLGVEGLDVNPSNMLYDDQNNLLKLAIPDAQQEPAMKIQGMDLIFAPSELLKVKESVNAEISLKVVDVYCWAMTFYFVLLNRRILSWL